MWLEKTVSQEQAVQCLRSLAERSGVSWGDRSLTRVLDENRRSPVDKSDKPRGNRRLWGFLNFCRDGRKVVYRKTDLAEWFYDHALPILQDEKARAGRLH